MDHAEATRKFAAEQYLLGELTEQEQEEFELHFFSCPDCAETVEAGAALVANAKAVFEAIVCENPFPAAYFPDLGFNQAVLKAMFIEVSVRRIEGLSSRITPELRRMASDYASERRAAGRAIPEDTTYVIEHR